jgi:hypothetical protein
MQWRNNYHKSVSCSLNESQHGGKQERNRAVEADREGSGRFSA